MSFDPNRDPDLGATPNEYRRRSASKATWLVIAAAVILAGFAYFNWIDRPGTDHTTTSSTLSDTAPAPAPASPAPATETPALAPPTTAPSTAKP